MKDDMPLNKETKISHSYITMVIKPIFFSIYDVFIISLQANYFNSLLVFTLSNINLYIRIVILNVFIRTMYGFTYINSKVSNSRTQNGHKIQGTAVTKVRWEWKAKFLPIKVLNCYRIISYFDNPLFIKMNVHMIVNSWFRKIWLTVKWCSKSQFLLDHLSYL